MDKKQEETTYKLFAKAFHEVVSPDIQEIKEDISVIKERLGKMDERMDRHGKALDDHNERIGKLEKTPVLS